MSAFVCFELFVRPALRVLAGHADPGPRTTSLPLVEGLAEVNDRPTYRPAKREPRVGSARHKCSSRKLTPRLATWRGAAGARALRLYAAEVMRALAERRVAIDVQAHPENQVGAL